LADASARDAPPKGTCAAQIFRVILPREESSSRGVTIHELFDGRPNLDWFSEVEADGYVAIEVGENVRQLLASAIAVPLRRCYISDARIAAREADGRLRQEVLAAVLPPRGSVMAGDFGEILTAIFQGT